MASQQSLGERDVDTSEESRMTFMQGAETAGVSLAAGLTATAAVIEGDITGFLAWAIPIGIAAIVGYFSAQITVRSEIAAMKTALDDVGDSVRRVDSSVQDSEMRIRDEMRTYYQRRNA